jgi:hypothetical protein
MYAYIHFGGLIINFIIKLHSFYIYYVMNTFSTLPSLWIPFTISLCFFLGCCVSSMAAISLIESHNIFDESIWNNIYSLSKFKHTILLPTSIMLTNRPLLLFIFHNWNYTLTYHLSISLSPQPLETSILLSALWVWPFSILHIGELMCGICLLVPGLFHLT